MADAFLEHIIHFNNENLFFVIFDFHEYWWDFAASVFLFVLSLYIHTYVNTPSRLHVPLKLGARNPREWKLADTLKMRFSDQLCYCFSFSTDVFWNVTFNLGRLHFFSSNWLIVVSQKPPQCIALPWMYVSWFTPSSFFYVNERPGLMGVMLFLVSPHSIT